MAEYRHNLITDRWVIIAPERARRPRDFARRADIDLPDFDANCPFCPGQECMTPPETFAVRVKDSKPDSPGWSVRVIPNKFPFLSPTGNSNISNDNYNNHDAAGHHEVLIESPHHNVHFARHEHEQGLTILRTLKDRYRFLAEQDSIRYISLFCNHGRGAGASMAHPHFQIAASATVPSQVMSRLQYCSHYYNIQHKSVFETTIEAELATKARIIAVTDRFVTFCPYASMCPFEVYILTRQNQSNFGEIEADSLSELADILHSILSRLDSEMNDPDYNLVFHTARIDYDKPGGFRWYIQLYPRLGASGGFELATDVYINVITPESAASFYRGTESQ